MSSSAQIVECIPVFGFESKRGVWMCWFVCHDPEGKHTLTVLLSNKLKVLKIFFQMKDASRKREVFFFCFLFFCLFRNSICTAVTHSFALAWHCEWDKRNEGFVYVKMKRLSGSCTRIRWSLLIKSLRACKWRLPEKLHTHENKETHWWSFPSVLCRILDLQMQPSGRSWLENVCQKQHEAQRESWHDVCCVSCLIFRAFMLVVVITSAKCQLCM